MTEEQLLKKLKQGQPGAFKDLVTSHQDKVIQTCYRFVGNREDAEDVAQDVFIEAYRSLPKFRGDSKISTWIYRITVSKSLDYLRKKRRKKRFAGIQRLVLMKEKGFEPEASPESIPDTVLEEKERSKVLAKAFESLPENQRIALTMNKYEGFKYIEIAEIMGTSLSAVESLIYRGTQNLRKKLFHVYDQII